MKDIVTNVTNVTKTQAHTMFEKDDSKIKNSSKNTDGKNATGSHKARRAHNVITRKDHIADVSEVTKEVLSSIWPMTNGKKLGDKFDDPSKLRSSIATSDQSDTLDPSNPPNPPNPPNPRLSLRHTQTARVFTNEDLASEDDG